MKEDPELLSKSEALALFIITIASVVGCVILTFILIGG